MLNNKKEYDDDEVINLNDDDLINYLDDDMLN
jgi:hypothetical protein